MVYIPSPAAEQLERHGVMENERFDEVQVTSSSSSSFTRSNFQSEGVGCHPGVLALWPKITLRMKEKGLQGYKL